MENHAQIIRIIVTKQRPHKISRANIRNSSNNPISSHNNWTVIPHHRTIIMLLLSVMYPIHIRPIHRPRYCPAIMVFSIRKCCNSRATIRWCQAAWRWPIEIKIILWAIAINSNAVAIYRCKEELGNFNFWFLFSSSSSSVSIWAWRCEHKIHTKTGEREICYTQKYSSLILNIF